MVVAFSKDYGNRMGIRNWAKAPAMLINCPELKLGAIDAEIHWALAQNVESL